MSSAFEVDNIKNYDERRRQLLARASLEDYGKKEQYIFFIIVFFVAMSAFVLTIFHQVEITTNSLPARAQSSAVQDSVLIYSNQGPKWSQYIQIDGETMYIDNASDDTRLTLKTHSIDVINESPSTKQSSLGNFLNALTESASLDLQPSGGTLNIGAGSFNIDSNTVTFSQLSGGYLYVDSTLKTVSTKANLSFDILGTTNQIIVTSSGEDIILSTPQDIDTLADVQFNSGTFNLVTSEAIIVDATSTTAFVARKNSSGGDVVVIDTTNSQLITYGDIIQSNSTLSDTGWDINIDTSTATSAESGITINRTYQPATTTSNTKYGIYAQCLYDSTNSTFTGGDLNTPYETPIRSYAYTAGANNITSMGAISCESKHLGTSTLTNNTGASLYARNSSTGIITNNIGINSYALIESGGTNNINYGIQAVGRHNTTTTCNSNKGIAATGDNASSGTISSNSGGSFYATNSSTGNITTNVCIYGQARNVSSGIITTNYVAYFDAWNYGSGNMTTNYGLQAIARNSYTGTIATNYGAYIQAYKGGAGDITTNYGVSIYSGNTTGTGTLSTNYGIYINTPVITGAITTSHGIYLADQTGASTSYAIYSAGGTSYHAGSLGLGTIPMNKLDVEGACVIGAGYAGLQTVTANSLLVEGKISVGTTSANRTLNVGGDATITSDLFVSTSNTGLWLGSLARIYRISSTALYIQSEISIQMLEDSQSSCFYLAGDTGNIGIGYNFDISAPVNTLDVSGGVAIGSTYAGTNTAPTNGLIVKGFVGINETSPATQLNVANTVHNGGFKFDGAVTQSGGYSNQIMWLQNELATVPVNGMQAYIIIECVGTTSTNANQYIDFRRGSTVTKWTMGNYGPGTDSFRICAGQLTATPALSITSGGNVGIGLATAANKLDVEGAVSIGATYSGSYPAPTNGLIVEGNVSIGKFANTYPLDVVGAGYFTGDITTEGKFVSTAGKTSTYISCPSFSLAGTHVTYTNPTMTIGSAGCTTCVIDMRAAQSTATYLRMADYYTSSMGIKGVRGTTGVHTETLNFFITNSSAVETDVMTINSNLNVMIGTTTDTGYKLNVNGSGYYASTLTTATSLTIGNSVLADTGWDINLDPSADAGSNEYGVDIRRNYSPSIASSALKETLHVGTNFNSDGGALTGFLRTAYVEAYTAGLNNITKCYAIYGATGNSGCTGTVATQVGVYGSSSAGTGTAVTSNVGVQGYANTSSSTVASNYGMNSTAIHNSTTTCGSNYGIYSLGTKTSTGEITNNYAGYFATTNSNATSKITNNHGVYIQDVTGGNTVDVNFGLRIAAITGGTTDWAIYSEGGQSAHVGNLRIGSTSPPTVALDVTGAANISTSLTIGNSVLADTGWDINLAPSDDTAAVEYGMTIDRTYTPLTASSANKYGTSFSTTFNSSNGNLTGSYYNTYIATNLLGSNTISTGYGLYNYVYNGGATVTSQYGAYISSSGGSSTSITNHYGLNIITSSGTATVTYAYGIAATSQHNGAGTTCSNNRGIYAYGQNSSSGTITSNYGSYSQASNTNASGTVGNNYGVYANTTNVGTMTSSYGVYSKAENSLTMTNNYGLYTTTTNGASGTITYNHGLYITDISNSALLTAVGTNYGLRIQAIDSGNTNWAIYSEGGQSAHVGNLRIGSTVAPTVALDVTGAAKISGDLTVDTNTLYVDSTNNRVSIGDTSPNTYLCVGPSGGVNGLGFTPGISMRSASGLNMHYTVGQDSSHMIFMKWVYNATINLAYASISTYEGSNNIVIQETGFANVLIGTTTDLGYKLNVNGSGYFASTLTTATSLTIATSVLANTGWDINLDPSTDAASGEVGVAIDRTYTPSIASSVTKTGTTMNTTFSSTNGALTGSYRTLWIASALSGINNITNAYGFESNISSTCSGTVTNQYGIRTTSSGGSGTVTNNNGIASEVYSGSGTVGTNNGVYTIAHHNSTTTLGYNVGINVSAKKTSTGQITNNYAGYFQTSNSNVTSKIINNHGIYILDVDNSGTVDVNFGLRIAAITGGTTDWAIYSEGGQSAHAGNLRIGSTSTPTVALDVTGAAKISTSLTIGGGTALSTYLETTITDLTWQGPFTATSANQTVYIVKTGKQITLTIQGYAATANSSSTITNTTAIAAAYRPNVTIYGFCLVNDNTGSYTSGNFSIDTAGTITIGLTDVAAFTSATGTNGFRTFTVTFESAS